MGVMRLANLLLKPGERVRNVWRIIWMEQLERVCPENPYGVLLAYLASLHVPCACSPVHDMDEYDESDVKNWRTRHGLDRLTGKPLKDCPNPEDEFKCPQVGTKKKSHVHVVFQMPGGWDREQFTEMMRDLLDLRSDGWERVLSMTSALRYLAHQDSEDKHKYKVWDVHGFGGIDLSCLLKEDNYSRYEVLCYVLNYVEDNKVRHFAQLVRAARAQGDPDVLNCVVSRFGFFARYFASLADIRKELADVEKAKTKQGGVSDE